MKFVTSACILATLSSSATALNWESSLRNGLENHRMLKAKSSKAPKATKATKEPKAKKSSKAPKGPKESKAPKAPKSGSNALLEIELDVFGEVHPAKMDIGPDQRIYFTGGTDSRAYRVDIEGNAEMFAEITTGAGFTLGCQFDGKGNYYMVNGAGVYMVSADKLSDETQPLPIEPENIFPWTTSPAIPMSIDVDNNTDCAYVSDMGKGEIWRIDINTREGKVWASSADGTGAYALLYGEPDSTNFLGVPFGVVEVMVDANSEWLYFSAHERNFFGRIRILPNGDAGELQVLGEVENRAALNGAFLDVIGNKLYGATPFLDFQNGVARDPNAVRGGEIWMIDIDDVADDGTGGTPERILSDLDYGTLTDVITGHNFGNPSDLYLLDGSFDTLVWPTGVLPDPDAPYHGAVRVLKGGGGGKSPKAGRRRRN